MNDVLVAILTGGRPQLLARTLRALASCGSWNAVALVNGGDRPTLDVLGHHPWISVENRPGKIRKIGPAVSELLEIAVQAGPSYILHLEDDWACREDATRWLGDAIAFLGDAGVGQVRLRRASEKVLRTSMITGAKIRWRHIRGHMRSPNAHLTFNANLMRAGDVSQVYPCDDEPHAQLRFAALDLDVVQHVPGAFAHIGHESLRRTLLGDRH